METKQLGDYSLIKQIGQGALGSVFLAEHRLMKKQFALKLLPQELTADRTFVQRCEEELSSLAVLDHPHIAKVHNISFDQGQYFLVLDCIVDEVGETTNLAQYLASKGALLKEEEIYTILLQLADALDWAHTKCKVAHRGIKLNNVLITKKKGELHVFLTDFGLFKIVGPGAVLTRTYKNMAESLGFLQEIYPGKKDPERYPAPSLDVKKQQSLHLSFVQSFSFLAPEQKRSEKQDEMKSDAYALGVLAYYLLTGEWPEGYFPMPSQCERSFSYNWDPCIKRLLRKDPKERPEALVPIIKSVFEKNEEVLSSQDDSFEGLRPVFRFGAVERPKDDFNPAAVFQIDSNVKHYTPETSEERENIQPILTDLKIIPGGAFFQGSRDGNRDEMPRHQIFLPSFALDIHPVTNEQFVRFLEYMGGEKDSNHQDIIRLKDSRIKRSGGKLSIESGYSKHPVVGVTWYGAIAYAKWVGKRLPTEAEWEIAAKGGHENLLYPTGDEIEKHQANFFSSDTTAVMSYAENGYGLFDMPGNVYEWCHDWYGYNYYETSVQEPENPKGPLQGVYRVLRGGCWKSLKEDLRCSRRHRNNPGTVNGTYGFRCAADVESY